MANTKAVRFNAPKFQPITSAAYHFNDFVNAAAAALNDTFDYLIPAGVEISSLAVQSQALDTNGTPTMAFQVGYLPADATSALTPNLTYFAPAGQVTGRAGGRLFCSFEPIKFNEDVIVRITVSTAAATFQAGRLWTIVSGNCDGPK
jgi:hypothetical protein